MMAESGAWAALAADISEKAPALHPRPTAVPLLGTFNSTDHIDPRVPDFRT